ncbi:MAG: succinate dehydrogenase/fumarate reductase iron-sulfur subunit [Alphaproteobacteria bacterium]|nr:succinate dehydrogenase/fumarate reductase iron-sulfur subunit [Alphaproteobacteria bacterium]
MSEPAKRKRTLRAWRGDASGGKFEEYTVEVDQGMVVLDLVHRAQRDAEGAGDMACRWNCKAGKCGSCSMEINGKPKLACMTRLGDYAPDEVIQVQPLKTFPIIRDLTTDVSWNYEQNKKIAPFTPPPRPEGDYRMKQKDVDRIQEFRKCIECFLCQDTCHVLRDHDKKAPATQPAGKPPQGFIGPRFMIRVAQLDMHPLDTVDRIPKLKEEWGSGYCNITKCCTEVCPEHINITDNGIIPMKERVVDRFYDPITMLLSKLGGGSKRTVQK